MWPGTECWAVSQRLLAGAALEDVATPEGSLSVAHNIVLLHGTNPVPWLSPCSMAPILVHGTHLTS